MYGGMPPIDTREHLPRWLLALAIVAGLTLLIALLRYAVDLLGVVFLIILVGFSIRTVSDWLTEGESVSIWAVTALSTGLLGSALVGLWVFSSPEISGTSIIDRLPGPMVNGMQWLESKGWGQRVLLPRPGALDGARANSIAGRAGSSVAPSPGSSTSGGSGAPTKSTDTDIRSASASKGVAPSRSGVAEGRSTVVTGNNTRPQRRGARDSASAAPTSAPSPVASQSPAAVSEPVAPTITELRMWPTPAIVGKSVRLTALVRAESQSSPSGTVTFYRNGSALGTVPVNPIGPGRGEAVLVTLSLPLGTHEITARYSGSKTFSGSEGGPLSASVERK